MMLSCATKMDGKNTVVKFLQCVERHPALYDFTQPGYSDQEREWKEVAKEMKEAASVCKEKWRNLRGCLIRHLRLMHTSDPSKTTWKRPYYLAEHMQFLIPFTKYGGRMEDWVSSSVKHEIEDDCTSNSFEVLNIKSEPDELLELEDIVDAFPKEPDVHDVEETPTNHIPSVIIGEPNVKSHSNNSDEDSGGASETSIRVIEPDIQESFSPLRINRLKRGHNSKIMHKKRNKLMRADSSFSSTNTKEDNDLNFFKSLLSDVRKMNDRQKLQFKKSVLDSIQEALYGDS